MQNDITPERIANAISQDKHFTGVYLLVEGSIDLLTYSKFVVRPSVRVRPAFGWKKVKAVLKILAARGHTHCFGIIDSDFSKLLHRHRELEPVFQTDFHDLETLIFNTDALTAVLLRYSTFEIVEAFEKAKGMSARQMILEHAERIALLRLANYLDNLGLHFKPARPTGSYPRLREFVDEGNFDFLGVKRMIDSLRQYSQNRGTLVRSQAEIEASYNNLVTQTFDLNQLVNGHDLCYLTYILLKNVLRSGDNRLQDFKTIESDFGFVYEAAEFYKTDLYQSVKSFGTRTGIVGFR